MSHSTDTVRRATRRTPARSRFPIEYVASIGIAVGVLAAWELVAFLQLVNPIVLPAPSRIFRALYDILTSGFILTDFGVTLYETMVGFVIGAAIGLVGGVLTGTFRFFRQTMYPYIVAFQGIPKISLAPLFLTWFGFGLESKIVMAVVLSFFPVLINTATGIQSVGQNELMLMRSYRATQRQIFSKLTLPHALPYIFAGLQTSLSFALIGAIVGEFIGARDGLGVLLVTYNYQIRIDYVFAVIIILGVLGLVLYQLVDVLNRRLVFWQK